MQLKTFSLQNQRGATLLMVLVLVVILGLAAGMTGTTWKTIMQRVKEEELLFRGDQYRRAIQSYLQSGHAGQRASYPADLKDLLRDPRTPATKRHLRKLYKDPMTGEDFEVIKDQASGGRIKGVRSASLEEPFKKGNFAAEYENFKDAKAYRDWEFIFEPGKNSSTNSTGGTTIEGLPAGSIQPPPGTSPSSNPSTTSRP